MTTVKHINLDLSEEDYALLKQLKGEKDWKSFILELAQSQNPTVYYSRKISELSAIIKDFVKDPFRRLLIDKITHLYILVLSNKIDEAREVEKDIADSLGLEVKDNEDNEEIKA